MTEPQPESGGSWQPPSLPVARPVNHLLRQASWARARLQPFSGKTLKFDAAPFVVALRIRESGEVEDASPAVWDAAFTVTPGIMVRLLAQDRAAWQSVRTDGDTALAREVLFITQNLRWDVEEDLSRVFGDIFAHRMVEAGNELKRWPQQTADSLARSLAAYWTEEQPLLATRTEVDRFNQGVDALRDDTARLEQRIAKLGRTETPQA
jgi:ubiquinone biosynthesis accessory factor UbiJ